MHYNFVRIHQTLKITPAMAAGVTSKLWEMSDMVEVLENWEAAGNRWQRGPFCSICAAITIPVNCQEAY